MGFVAFDISQETGKACVITPEARVYIEQTFLAHCSPEARNDAKFREMVLQLCAASGFVNPQATAARSAEAAQAVVEQERRLRECMSKAAAETVIPDKYRGAEYDPDYWPELEHAIRSTATGVKYHTHPDDLYVHGQSHTGKSHAAAELAARIAAQGKSVAWVTCPQLRNLYEDGIGDKAKRLLAQDIKQEAILADLTVLDDIGKDDTASGDRRTLSFFGRALYEIIEERQKAKNKLTVYTSEYAPDDPALADRLTNALTNRIIDKCAVIGDAPKVLYRVWLADKIEKQEKSAQ